MLFDVPIWALCGILTVIFKAWPSWSWPASWLENIEYLLRNISFCNFFVDLNYWFTCIEAFVSFSLIIATVRVIRGIANWIRGADGL